MALMNEACGTVFTIGHSTHALEAFIALLRRHDVTAVADVRSAPYSRFNPQFNREPFADALVSEGLRYVFLGNSLGGRSDDPACCEDGRIRYDRVAETESFKSGLAASFMAPKGSASRSCVRRGSRSTATERFSSPAPWMSGASMSRTFTPTVDWSRTMRQ